MGGICGAGMRRAADALLRAMGGDSVSLMVPATAMANDAGGQLGLVDPGMIELLISHVVTRELTTGSVGPRRRVEFTLPASMIENQLAALGMGSGDDLFKAVIGLTYGNELFHIENVAPQSFGGTVCFYLVTAVE
ncbi:MAG TPA: hypothetical protein VMS18_28445 [Candidatus Binatia bacterium]|nr:hypothetical protein [Candidatus Binatia bacterium]